MLLCLRPGLFRLTDLGVVISEPNITLITFGVTSYALSRADVENRLASNLNSNIETSSEGFSEPLATTGDVGLKKGKVTYRPSPLDLDTTLVDLGSNYAKQSIISFLEKPYELRSGTWDASSTGTFISVNLPSELITTPIYQNKAMGHLCFRATIVLRLQVNATRFSQGRLIMSYIPQAPVLNSWYKGRLLDLTTITQLPNVQLDANCDKEVVLEIPYTSPTTHYGLLSQLGPACGAFVSVYSPLATVSGLDVAQYILWGSFKNVELVTPTSATPFTTQGPAIRTRNRDPSDQEAEAAELMPISGALSKVSRASTILAEIPLLTSIAGPTAWLTRAASKAAAAFGWSNPTVLSPVKRIVNFGHSYANNCDAGQSALPLSLSSDNKVGILPGVGATDIDEMSLSFIASNPAYYASYNWSIVNIPGTVIYGQDLAPANFTHAYTDTVLTGTAGNTIYYRTMTPISFITRNFAYYRGSLKFTFKLVKTEFHTGRLLLTYSPGYFSDPTITESTYLMREVIDISKGSEFSYTIPFAAVTPWLPSGTSYGRLSLLVLNNLAAPATVTSTIQILVEVSGADDFQWFGPYATEGELNIPYMPSGTFNGGVFTSQMDDLCDITDQNTIIAAGSLHSNDLAALNYCAGEAITSVSQLLKRSCHLSTSAHWPNAVVEMIFRPFSIYALSAARATFTTDFPLICNDYFSLFSSCFAYNRGSVVLRQAAWGGTQYRFYSKLFFFTSSFIPGVTNTGIYATNTATSTISNNLKSHTFQDSNLAIANAVVIPNYNQCHARLCRYSMNELDSVVMEPVDTYSSNVWCQVNLNAGAASLRIERSVGDDFQLSFFLGVPPICYATATL